MSNTLPPLQNAEDTSESGSIDLDMFNTMKESVGAIFTEVVIAFNESAIEILDKLSNWNETYTEEELIRFPHTLKSSSANVGAMQLSTLAATCEQLAINGEKQKALNMATELNSEYENVKARLNELGY